MARVVGDQAERPALDAQQRGDQAGSELAPQFQHAVPVGQDLDRLADVVGTQAVLRHQVAQLALVGATPVGQRALE